MRVQLKLLHSRPEDAAMYDAVVARDAPDANVTHVVQPNWRHAALAGGMTWQLRREIEALVANTDAPLACSCPILAEAAESAGAYRLDRELMRLAALSAAPRLLVTLNQAAMDHQIACLEEAMAAQGSTGGIVSLVLDHCTGLLTSGDHAGFAAAIAAAVIEMLSERPELQTVILTESCMRPAAHLLKGAGPQVLTLPDHGIGKLLGVHARASFGDPITT